MRQQCEDLAPNILFLSDALLEAYSHEHLSCDDEHACDVQFRTKVGEIKDGSCGCSCLDLFVKIWMHLPIDGQREAYDLLLLLI